MIKLTNNSIIYVICPFWSATGGIESLHQLLDKLNYLGLKAYAVYIDYKKEIVKNADIREEYKCYNVKQTNIIEDNKNNLVIVPEINAELVFRFKESQLMIYWLSVDNFYWSFRHELSHIDMFKWDIRYAVRTNMLGKYYHKFIKKDKAFLTPTLYIKDLIDKEIIHAYQSKYAQNFLIRNGFKYIIELNDYINSGNLINDFNKTERKDVVLYNPRKGIKFTNKLIKRAPHLNWIPLQNMNRNQVNEKLQHSKIYIDFGGHPGRDRFPREAVMNGCCVITGLKGSSSYFEDIPIDKQYKFKDKTQNIKKIIKKIEEIFLNYNIHFENFSFYRRQIIHDEIKLEHLILKYFINNNLTH